MLNMSTAIFLVNKDVRAVRVLYDPNDERPKVTEDKTYVFKTMDATLKKDDLVVVPTTTRVGFTVCKVVEGNVDIDFDSQIVYKWIVAKIDRAPYDDTLLNEQKIIDIVKSAEVRKKREELARAIVDDRTGAELKAISLSNLNP